MKVFSCWDFSVMGLYYMIKTEPPRPPPPSLPPDKPPSAPHPSTDDVPFFPHLISPILCNSITQTTHTSLSRFFSLNPDLPEETHQTCFLTNIKYSFTSFTFLSCVHTCKLRSRLFANPLTSTSTDLLAPKIYNPPAHFYIPCIYSTNTPNLGMLYLALYRQPLYLPNILSDLSSFFASNERIFSPLSHHH